MSEIKVISHEEFLKLKPAPKAKRRYNGKKEYRLQSKRKHDLEALQHGKLAREYADSRELNI